MNTTTETRWNLCFAVILAAAGFVMTIYSAAIITGLIVHWLTRPY
jgi:hypothetical protein